jgi:hypothetical protein
MRQAQRRGSPEGRRHRRTRGAGGAIAPSKRNRGKT